MEVVEQGQEGRHGSRIRRDSRSRRVGGENGRYGWRNGDIYGDRDGGRVRGGRVRGGEGGRELDGCREGGGDRGRHGGKDGAYTDADTKAKTEADTEADIEAEMEADKEADT